MDDVKKQLTQSVSTPVGMSVASLPDIDTETAELTDITGAYDTVANSIPSLGKNLSNDIMARQRLLIGNNYGPDSSSVSAAISDYDYQKYYAPGLTTAANAIRSAGINKALQVGMDRAYDAAKERLSNAQNAYNNWARSQYSRNNTENVGDGKVNVNLDQIDTQALRDAGLSEQDIADYMALVESGGDANTWATQKLDEMNASAKQAAWDAGIASTEKAWNNLSPSERSFYLSQNGWTSSSGKKITDFANDAAGSSPFGGKFTWEDIPQSFWDTAGSAFDGMNLNTKGLGAFSNAYNNTYAVSGGVADETEYKQKQAEYANKIDAAIEYFSSDAALDSGTFDFINQEFGLSEDDMTRLKDFKNSNPNEFDNMCTSIGAILGNYGQFKVDLVDNGKGGYDYNVSIPILTETYSDNQAALKRALTSAIWFDDAGNMHLGGNDSADMEAVEKAWAAFSMEQAIAISLSEDENKAVDPNFGALGGYIYSRQFDDNGNYIPGGSNEATTYYNTIAGTKISDWTNMLKSLKTEQLVDVVETLYNKKLEGSVLMTQNGEVENPEKNTFEKKTSGIKEIDDLSPEDAAAVYSLIGFELNSDGGLLNDNAKGLIGNVAGNFAESVVGSAAETVSAVEGLAVGAGTLALATSPAGIIANLADSAFKLSGVMVGNEKDTSIMSNAISDITKERLNFVKDISTLSNDLFTSKSEFALGHGYASKKEKETEEQENLERLFPTSSTIEKYGQAHVIGSSLGGFTEFLAEAFIPYAGIAKAGLKAPKAVVKTVGNKVGSKLSKRASKVTPGEAALVKDNTVVGNATATFSDNISKAYKSSNEAVGVARNSKKYEELASKVNTAETATDPWKAKSAIGDIEDDVAYRVIKNIANEASDKWSKSRLVSVNGEANFALFNTLQKSTKGADEAASIIGNASKQAKSLAASVIKNAKTPKEGAEFAAMLLKADKEMAEKGMKFTFARGANLLKKAGAGSKYKNIASFEKFILQEARGNLKWFAWEMAHPDNTDGDAVAFLRGEDGEVSMEEIAKMVAINSVLSVVTEGIATPLIRSARSNIVSSKLAKWDRRLDAEMMSALSGAPSSNMTRAARKTAKYTAKARELARRAEDSIIDGGVSAKSMKAVNDAERAVNRVKGMLNTPDMTLGGSFSDETLLKALDDVAPFDGTQVKMVTNAKSESTLYWSKLATEFSSTLHYGNASAAKYGMSGNWEHDAQALCYILDAVKKAGPDVRAKDMARHNAMAEVYDENTAYAFDRIINEDFKAATPAILGKQKRGVDKAAFGKRGGYMPTQAVMDQSDRESPFMYRGLSQAIGIKTTTDYALRRESDFLELLSHKMAKEGIEIPAGTEFAHLNKGNYDEELASRINHIEACHPAYGLQAYHNRTLARESAISTIKRRNQDGHIIIVDKKLGDSGASFRDSNGIIHVNKNMADVLTGEGEHFSYLANWELPEATTIGGKVGRKLGDKQKDPEKAKRGQSNIEKLHEDQKQWIRESTNAKDISDEEILVSDSYLNSNSAYVNTGGSVSRTWNIFSSIGSAFETVQQLELAAGLSIFNAYTTRQLLSWIEEHPIAGLRSTGSIFWNARSHKAASEFIRSKMDVLTEYTSRTGDTFIFDSFGDMLAKTPEQQNGYISDVVEGAKNAMSKSIINPATGAPRKLPSRVLHALDSVVSRTFDEPSFNRFIPIMQTVQMTREVERLTKFYNRGKGFTNRKEREAFDKLDWNSQRQFIVEKAYESVQMFWHPFGAASRAVPGVNRLVSRNDEENEFASDLARLKDPNKTLPYMSVKRRSQINRMSGANLQVDVVDVLKNFFFALEYRATMTGRIVNSLIGAFKGWTDPAYAGARNRMMAYLGIISAATIFNGHFDEDGNWQLTSHPDDAISILTNLNNLGKIHLTDDRVGAVIDPFFSMFTYPNMLGKMTAWTYAELTGSPNGHDITNRPDKVLINAFYSPYRALWEVFTNRSMYDYAIYGPEAGYPEFMKDPMQNLGCILGHIIGWDNLEGMDKNAKGETIGGAGALQHDYISAVESADKGDWFIALTGALEMPLKSENYDSKAKMALEKEVTRAMVGLRGQYKAKIADHMDDADFKAKALQEYEEQAIGIIEDWRERYDVYEYRPELNAVAEKMLTGWFAYLYADDEERTNWKNFYSQSMEAMGGYDKMPDESEEEYEKRKEEYDKKRYELKDKETQARLQLKALGFDFAHTGSDVNDRQYEYYESLRGIQAQLKAVLSGEVNGYQNMAKMRDDYQAKIDQATKAGNYTLRKQLEEEYINALDSIIFPYIEKYGYNIINRYNTHSKESFANIAGEYVIIPANDSKKFKNENAKQNWLRNRYGTYRYRDNSNLPTDAEAVASINKVMNDINKGANAIGLSRINSILDKYESGYYNLSKSDLEVLYNMKRNLKGGQ